jgi:DNA modification methylase
MALAPGSVDPMVWDDIVRMRTLNAEQARKGAEKHVCPLQFDIVDRLIDFFSMPGELVFDPFAGLGTVPMRAVEMGRRGAGSELNPDYFRFACGYLRAAEDQAQRPSLFEVLGLDEAA